MASIITIHFCVSDSKKCLRLFVDSKKESHILLFVKNWIFRCKQQIDDDFKAQINANKTNSITDNLAEKFFLEGRWELTIKENQNATVLNEIANISYVLT